MMNSIPALIVNSVFAIHGLGSNPYSAWTYLENGTEARWLKDILPKEKGLENIRIAMINHQTRWHSNTPDMPFEEHAAMILDDIESLHQVQNKPPFHIALSLTSALGLS
jgi:hypothetical protein